MGGTQRRAQAALGPDVGDATLAQRRAIAARLDQLHQIEQCRLSFAETHVIDAVVTKHLGGSKGGMQPTHDHRYLASLAQLAQQVARTQPLPCREREADESRPRLLDRPRERVDAVIHADARECRLVPGLPERRGQERRSERRDRPCAFGIDLDEQDIHRNEPSTRLRFDQARRA